MKRFIPFLIIALFLTACGKETGLTLTRLTVEQQDGSRALATNTPRFSWQYDTEAKEVTQTSYRVIVATTVEKALQNQGDLWDSGIVESNQMLYIPYAGSALKSRDKAYWKVITTTRCKNRKVKSKSEV